MKSREGVFWGKGQELLPDSVLRAQLFQYAEDMRQIMSEHADLQWRYRLLEEAYVSLGGSRAAIDRLAECVYDMYLVTDDVGRVRYANRRVLDKFAARSPFGLPLTELFSPGLAKSAVPLEPDCVGSLNYCLTDCDDSCRLRVLQTLPDGAGDGAGSTGLVHWFIRDIPGRPQATVPAPAHETKADGLLIFGTDGDILAANPTFLGVAGYDADRLIGQPLTLLGSELQPRLDDPDIWRQLRESGHWYGPMYTRTRSGDTRRDWAVISAAIDQAGSIASCLAVFSDLLPLRESEKRLAHLAHHDPLTGLPNRRVFQDRLELALIRSRQTRSRGAVVFIDLDGFKPVNDTYGHAVGDLLLQEVARRLEAVMRKDDIVARLGGDEFAILVERIKTVREAHSIGQKLTKVLHYPIMVSGHALSVGGSIGIVVFPEGGGDTSTLLHRADHLMYAVKRSGGGTFRVYEVADKPGLGEAALA